MRAFAVVALAAALLTGCTTASDQAAAPTAGEEAYSASVGGVQDGMP